MFKQKLFQLNLRLLSCRRRCWGFAWLSGETRRRVFQTAAAAATGSNSVRNSSPISGVRSLKRLIDQRNDVRAARGARPQLHCPVSLRTWV